MTVLKAHFDGKVLVPDEPVNLPVNCALEVYVHAVAQPGSTRPDTVGGKTFLQNLADELDRFPTNPSAPTDAAAQHDHYLYGTPKR